MIRAVFLGQKWIGERCFELVSAHSSVELCGVVTNDNADVWWRSNRIHERALDLGLPVLSNVRRDDDALAHLVNEQRPDVLLSVQHPWILPPHIMDMVDGKAFNMHSARLPDYRGHNAANHAILNGETTYTVTVHWMVVEVDAGPVAFEETIDVLPGDSARSLYERALPAGERAFGRLLDAITDDPHSVPRRELRGNGKFYDRSSIEAERHIPSLETSEAAVRARALYFPPFEPAYVLVEGIKQYVLPPGFARFASEFAGTHW